LVHSNEKTRASCPNSSTDSSAEFVSIAGQIQFVGGQVFHEFEVGAPSLAQSSPPEGRDNHPENGLPAQP
jgi:hypothetical protein